MVLDGAHGHAVTDSSGPGFAAYVRVTVPDGSRYGAALAEDESTAGLDAVTNALDHAAQS